MPSTLQSIENGSKSTNSKPNAQFIEGFRLHIKDIFHERWSFEQLCTQRGLPPEFLDAIMSYNPLSICIPKQYGGLGASVPESIALMSEASYESLGLSLMLSINYALFLQPVTKYGQEEAKKFVFDRFLKQKHMGGLMITEPNYGSDALNMQSSFTEDGANFHLKGTKHWAGLTGKANFWLLGARGQTSGGLKRDIDFFICDNDAPGQNIVVEEYYNNLGLYLIPYGRNIIDVKIPQGQRLVPHSTGVKMMLDILHRNRFQFPGMGMGFLKRILDEAVKHVQKRQVSNKALFEYDQVQQRLARMQANYTICSVLCIVGSERAGLENDTSSLGLEANVIKCITTDMMQESSQSLVQLFGAMGYRLDSVAGRAMVDSRPFQIFEGSNDILYIQIAEAFIKKMTASKETNLYEFLKSFELTNHASKLVKEETNFTISQSLSQRKILELGMIISRMVTLNYVLSISERGFNKELINGAVSILKQEIGGLINTYNYSQKTNLVSYASENSYWLDFTNNL